MEGARVFEADVEEVYGFGGWNEAEFEAEETVSERGESGERRRVETEDEPIRKKSDDGAVDSS